MVRDLEILDNGMVFDGGRLRHLWYEVVERENGSSFHVFKIVALRELTYVPIEARKDPDVLGKMRTVLRGLYNAKVDFAHVVAGMFDPPLGILQFYGVIGVDEERAGAEEKARVGMMALEATMANFPQSRLEPLDTRKAEWLLDALTSMPHVVAVIGHPDPRAAARGMGRPTPFDGQMDGAVDPEIASQQNEMVMRGMAKLREEFVMVTLASRVPVRDLAVMLEGIAREASIWASRQRGTRAISFGVAIPAILTGMVGDAEGRSYGEARSRSVSDAYGEAEGTAHTTGHSRSQAYTEARSEAVTEGWAHTRGVTRATHWGRAETHGTFQSRAETHGTTRTEGVSLTITGGSSDSMSRGVSATNGSSETHGAARTSSGSITLGHAEGTAQTTGESHSFAKGVNASFHSSAGGGAAFPSSAGVKVGDGVLPAALDARMGFTPSFHVEAGTQVGGELSWTDTSSEATTTSSQDTTSVSAGLAVTESSSHTEFGSTTRSMGRTHTEMRSNALSLSGSIGHTHSVTRSSGSSHAVTTSRGGSIARSSSTTVSHAVTTSRGKALGHFSSTTHSRAVTRAHSEAVTRGEAWSTADTRSFTRSRVHGVTETAGISRGRTLVSSFGGSVGVGLAPSVSISKTFQWEDDAAAILTELFRQQERLLDTMVREGGYLTDVYVMTRTEAGRKAVEALVPQAFHGLQDVVTPVRTRRLTPEEEEHLRLHALAFTPCAAEETIPGVMSGYRFASLLTMEQLAAYASPGMFEEGSALTVQERIPPVAFLPDMPGEVVLGHQVSPETGDLTDAQLRLTQEGMFHTVFAADTGFGKSVAAERLALETTLRWHYRTIVLDFGQGWRKMLNAPGLRGHVDIWQLYPGAVKPLRWNPLQIGRRISPDQQFRAICELFANAGRMGPRQLGFMRRTLRDLYLDHGVFTADRKVLGDPHWNTVRDEAEEEAVNAWRRERGLPERKLVGAHLANLEPLERQALAVHRSKAVDIADWYERLVKLYESIPPRNTTDRTSLEGVLLRLEPLTYGEMGELYGKGEGAIAIEDVALPWGLCVFEGGAELDEYSKAALLSLMAWFLYTDAVRRRRESIGQQVFTRMQIFFEEANKVLCGVDVGATSDDQSGRAQTTQLFQNMWRDGRKYGIFLHPIVQTPSELPAGILSSCNNAFIGQLKRPQDRDVAVAHIARSEKGFVDEHYRRFISRLPVARMLVKLGYSRDIRRMEPMLVEPLKVPALEPSDEEIGRMTWRANPHSQRWQA